MNVFQANQFHPTILDAIEREMAWFPMKHMTVRWMRRYINDSASHGWFQDSGNFISEVKTGPSESAMDVVATLKAWLAGFKQDIPYYLDWLKKIADWLLANIPLILELLSVFIPRSQMVAMA